MGRLIDRSYNNYLKDKRICLVGASGELRNNEQGEKIDSYDVVVRVNAGMFVQAPMKPCIGSKCDILYMGSRTINAWNRNEKLWSAPATHNISWAVSKVPYKDERFIDFKKNAGDIRLRALSETWRGDLYRRIGAFSPTGYLALSDLLCFDLKELYVTGFDFFRGGYYEKYGESEHGALNQNPGKATKPVKHKFEVFAKDFTRLYKNDKRITVDKVLREIIDEHE